MYEFKRHEKDDLVAAAMEDLIKASVAVQEQVHRLEHVEESRFVPFYRDDDKKLDWIENDRNLIQAQIEIEEHRAKLLARRFQEVVEMDDAAVYSIVRWVWVRYEKWFENLESMTQIAMIDRRLWIKFGDEGEAIATHLFLEGELNA